MKSWILPALLATLLLAAPASAHRRSFTFTYDWFTPVQGEQEIESYWTQARGGKVDAAVEYEYGVTSRYVVAPYLLAGREHGGKWSFDGGKLEQRYRFGHYAKNRLLPAVYLEVEKERDEPWTLEGKFITSYLFGRYIWSFNAITEQGIARRERLNWEYSTGVARYLKGGAVGAATWAGFELFGSLTERQHFAGPMVGHSFTPHDHLAVTGGIGLNRNSPPQVRLIFEHEWF